MRRLIALALALALIALVLAACPTGLLSWSNPPAGTATTNQCATRHSVIACKTPRPATERVRAAVTERVAMASQRPAERSERS